MKKVRFNDDIQEDKETEKCAMCQFRNIRPYVRNMSNCMSCKKQYCGFCMGTLMLCMKCYIFYIPEDMKLEDHDMTPRNLK